MLRKIIRDNPFVNALLRPIIFYVARISSRFHAIVTYYRVYGVVKLRIEGYEFKAYSRADDFAANEVYYRLEYDRDEFKLVQQLVKKCNYFVDIGANTGMYSLFAATSNINLQVMSFEPHPGNYKRLRTNVDLNSLTNMEAFPVAVGEVNTTIEFTIPDDDSLSTVSSANGDFTRNFHSIAYKAIQVQQVTLDSVLLEKKISRIDLIKIDVEYYELSVLRGAIDILSRIKPLILMEVLQYEALLNQFPAMKGRINEDHAQKIEELIYSHGYFPYRVHNDGLHRVDTNLKDAGERNFLFAPFRSQDQFISFDRINAVFQHS